MDLVFVTLANGNDGDENHLIIDAIDQAVSGATQFYLVAIGHARKRSGGHSWNLQPFRQLVFKRFSYAAVQFAPLGQGQLMKT